MRIEETGSFRAFSTVWPVMETLTGVPTFSVAFLLSDLQPDFDRGAAGIKRGTDQRDLRIHWILDSGDNQGCIVADLHLLRETLRDVRLGQQR